MPGSDRDIFHSCYPDVPAPGNSSEIIHAYNPALRHPGSKGEIIHGHYPAFNSPGRRYKKLHCTYPALRPAATNPSSIRSFSPPEQSGGGVQSLSYHHSHTGSIRQL